jgi:hypothetical protein
MSFHRMAAVLATAIAAVSFSRPGLAQDRPAPLRGAFTNLQRVAAPINSEHWESMGSLSADKLWIYFVSNRPPSRGSEFCVDLWVARRSRVDEPFGEPTNEGVLRHVNSLGDECTPNISSDDLVLTFYSDRHAHFSGNYEIYIATRQSPEDDFGPAVKFEEAYPNSGVSSGHAEFGQSMSCDRLSLHFASNRPGGEGGFDLYVATRDTPSGIFGNVRNLRSINTKAHEFSPIVSADNLTLFFSDLMPPLRARGLGGGDIWMVTRGSLDEDWEGDNVINLGAPINGPFTDFDFFVSHDWPAAGATIWFTSDRPQERHGNKNCSDSPLLDEIWDADIYTATWMPLEPFRRGDANADGGVNLTDAVFILLHLFAGGGPPSCDKAADVTDSGFIEITDAVYLLQYLFLRGAAIPEPHPGCGFDPTSNFYLVSCDSHPPCEAEPAPGRRPLPPELAK